MIQRTLKTFRVREVFILLALLAVLVLVLTLFRERTLTLIAPTELTSSGILDDLLPPFQDEHNVKVRMEGLSFDQLLKRTRSGEAEIAILDNEVDAADLLDEKIASQAGPVFSEQVLLVGPRANPARIAQQDALADSLRNIVATQSLFLSLSDGSATHRFEQAVWEQLGLAWYRDSHNYLISHAPVLEALQRAADEGAYVLVGKAAWLRSQARVAMMPFGQVGREVRYHAVVLSDKRFKNLNTRLAEELLAYLALPVVQERIAVYGADSYGEALYTPISPPSQGEAFQTWFSLAIDRRRADWLDSGRVATL